MTRSGCSSWTSSGTPSRWVRERDLRRVNGSYDSVGTDVTAIVGGDASLYDTLEEMIQSASGVCCVVDDSGALEGVVALGHLSKVILKAQREAERHYEEELEERVMSVDLLPPPGSDADAEPKEALAPRREPAPGVAPVPGALARAAGDRRARLGAVPVLPEPGARHDRDHPGQTLPLDWNTKLWPQIQTHLYMAFWSTLLVIVIAVPLGRPADPARLPTVRTGRSGGGQLRSGDPRLRAVGALPRHL